MSATVQFAQIELSAGGVIYRRASGSDLQMLLIKDSYGNWGFPKGHIEAGEDAGAAALRECREETGLGGLRLVERLGTTDWYFRQDKALVHKFCDYFLVEAEGEDTARPQKREGIQACEWLSPPEFLERVTYENARQIARRAVERAGGGGAESERGGSQLNSRADAVSAPRRKGK